MIEIALISFIAICTAGILENILCINDVLQRRYSDTQYGMHIVLDIAWITICAVALCVGGTFASAAISVATVYIILGILGDFCVCYQYRCISDAIGLALHIVLLILMLAV